MFPRPTPVSGLGSIAVNASADLGRASDPAAWTASGTAQSLQIHYRGTVLDRVATTFRLQAGRLDVPELSATLDGKPLVARAGLVLKPPYDFHGSVDLTGWELASILAWAPSAPRPSPVTGDDHGPRRGDGDGRAVPAPRTTGAGRFDRLQGGPVSLGDVPFSWTTKGDAVALTIADARPFGGRLTAEATVPLTAGRSVEGKVDLRDLDTARLSGSIPGRSIKLSGVASGEVTFTAPSDGSSLEAKVKLTAPDLTVQGVPAEHLNASGDSGRGPWATR